MSAPSPWQTMKTAPRDGTPLDLWTSVGRRTDCYWGEDYDKPEDQGWRQTYAENRSVSFRLTVEPTHWMPIPGDPE